MNRMFPKVATLFSYFKIMLGCSKKRDNNQVQRKK